MNDEIIVNIQRQLFEQSGRKVDAHYREGKGVLYVYEGEEFIPSNVIHAVSEGELYFMRKAAMFFE